jgi:hypothetical protein
MTQIEYIVAALKRGEKLTFLKALNEFGCANLKGRIWDIKQMGLDVRKNMIEVGDNKHVAEYYLANAGEQLRLI